MRNGRYILSSSRDWNCIIWDLQTGKRAYTIAFSSPIIEAQFHPRNKMLFAAIAQCEAPFVVTLEEGKWSKTQLRIGTEDKPAIARFIVSETSTVVFSPDGEHILFGTTKGSIFVYNVDSKSVISEFKTQGASSIQQMTFSPKKYLLLIETV
jgi:COMPASS component SWD1